MTEKTDPSALTFTDSAIKIYLYSAWRTKHPSFFILLELNAVIKVVGAEGIEPSTSSASRKHSPTELRAYSLAAYL